MKRLLIWGAGDQGMVTLDCALAMREYSRIDFLTIKEKGSREIPGYLVHKEEEETISGLIKTYDEAIVATGSNDLREMKTAILVSMEIALATVIHPMAVISPFAKISAGSAVMANAVININACIGVGCIVNTGADIEHDCILEDFVNVCPKVSMAGHTRIGRKTFLGIGSTMIDDIRIGKEATVGAGAVVIRDVPDHAIAVGVPAKIKIIPKIDNAGALK